MGATADTCNTRTGLTSKSQSGRGRGDSDYNRFIRAEMKTNGGKMGLAAKAWREHKQSGGHYARKDGTVSYRPGMPTRIR